MSRRITQDELESYLWGSAVLLRNHIDAGAYKQYIFPLLFFKRLNDVYEEETAKPLLKMDQRQQIGKKHIVFLFLPMHTGIQ